MGVVLTPPQSAWVSALRENLPLLHTGTFQSSHAQDRMAFVILWSCALGNFFFSISLS
jgi:hypothetical protein